MHNTLGDFKNSAYSWNTEARHLDQGKHIRGEPIHEHCLDGKEKKALRSCIPDQTAGRWLGQEKGLEASPTSLRTVGKWIVMGKTARGINLITFLIQWSSELCTPVSAPNWGGKKNQRKSSNFRDYCSNFLCIKTTPPGSEGGLFCTTTLLLIPAHFAGLALGQPGLTSRTPHIVAVTTIGNM